MICRAKILLTLSLALITVACGSPGAPLPPELELPQPVSDLRATRKGETVTLTWSAPTHTTEHRNINRSGIFEICRSLVPMKQCGTPVARIPFTKPAVGKPKTVSVQTYTDHLPSRSSDQPTLNFYYAVNALNSYGRTAGLSNQSQIPSTPTLPPPQNFQAQLSSDGVHLTWSPVPTPPGNPALRFFCRIYRRDTQTNVDAIAGEVPVSDSSLTDHSFEWEKTYDYRATVVTVISQPSGPEQQIEGDDAPPVRIFTHDVFPPDAPTGLQAVFSGPGQKPFIDLVWAPNSEPDLAGYNVYRREGDNSQPARLNSDLVKAPAFRDTSAVSGHTYFYSVSAVDLRGNESSRSTETSETVP